MNKNTNLLVLPGLNKAGSEYIYGVISWLLHGHIFHGRVILFTSRESENVNKLIYNINKSLNLIDCQASDQHCCYEA